MGWCFPRAVERHILKDTEGHSVLHLFGGHARFGIRMDIDPIVKPNIIGDAWLPPFGRDSFDVVVIDPPYTHINMQEKRQLLAAAAWIARKRVMWFHTIWIATDKRLYVERAWLIRVGDSCHARVLQYFIPKPEKVEPPRYFERGPAIRYNRWIANPAALPFPEHPQENS